MVSVYVSSEVAQVRDLHPYLMQPEFRARPVREQLAIQAETLHASFQSGDRRGAAQIMSWWPDARGAKVDDVFASEFTASDALTTLCREYGFSDANLMNSLGDLTLDEEFESILDLMLAGEAEELASQLERLPHLAAAHSSLGHGATLLHYLGANGVETHRQVTPSNAAAIADLLVQKGADKTAEANMYGGGQTAYALASTSAHPHRAGVAEELCRILQPS